MSRGHFTAALVAAILALAAPAAAHADSFPLVGWWPMNEGSGQTVRDWSGRGSNGFLGSTIGPDANDPSWIKGVFFGSALRFDGIDDFVSIPDTSALAPAKLTVAAWVRGTGIQDQFRYVISKGSRACDNSSYGIYTSGNRGLAFYIADVKQYYRSPEADPAQVWDGKWHHVAGTFDGNSVRFFVDGGEVGPGTPASTTIDYALPGGSGQIGSYPGTCNPGLTLRGDIDGVQVWSQALPIDTIWAALKPLFSLAK
jgi:hypothetical protein